MSNEMLIIASTKGTTLEEKSTVSLLKVLFKKKRKKEKGATLVMFLASHIEMQVVHWFCFFPFSVVFQSSFAFDQDACFAITAS